MTVRLSMLNPDCFEYHQEFVGKCEADGLFQVLWRDLAWVQKEIILFGRRVLQPRLIAWIGDPGARYRYSGLSLDPGPWHPLLLKLKMKLTEFTGCSFNSVLANAYRNGNDSMGWHQDNEAELGQRPCIASLSLGAERRFLVRQKGGKSSGILLQHGSLLMMKGDCQQRYQHSLPKTRKQAGLRINLTFREVRCQAPV